MREAEQKITKVCLCGLTLFSFPKQVETNDNDLRTTLVHFSLCGLGPLASLSSLIAAAVTNDR